jgi:hypothetical protein
MNITKRCLHAFLLTVASIPAQAQLCTNPTDSVYGLNSISGAGSGQIVSINVNTIGASSIGSPAASSANANGLGFSQITSLFYFFNQSGGGATEFASFNPLTGSKVAKAIPSGPALPTATTGKIRSGTCTSDGSGYYMIFPGATVAMGYPATAPAFYYYSIGSDTWTRITQSFRSVTGIVVTDFQNLNSGDMAFDGSNNLWMLISNSTQYALYRIKAPLPTTAVASVTVDTIIPATANPIGGVSFTGIAFNSAGTMYLSTGSCAAPPCAVQYNKLYEMTTPGVLTLKGTFAVNGIGDDLSSCVYPIGVLTASPVSLSAVLQNNSARLSWKVIEPENVTGYNVEFSADGERWQTIAFIPNDNGAAGSLKRYTYLHEEMREGVNYYRIVQLSASGAKNVSSVKTVHSKSANKILIGPNPVKDVIYFYNKANTTKLFAQIFDRSGQLVYSTVVMPDQQSINISQLPRGSFVLRLSSPLTNEHSGGYHFIKW